MGRRRKWERSASLDPMNHDGRRPPPGFWDSLRQNVVKAETRSLVIALTTLVGMSVVLGWLSVAHLRNEIVLAHRGVETEARVLWVHPGGRLPGVDLTVELLDDPSRTTRIEHPPSGMVQGSLLDVVYDPRDPGWATAVDAPLVDAEILFVAVLDVALLLGWALLLRGGVLAELWTRWRVAWAGPGAHPHARPVRALLRRVSREAREGIVKRTFVCFVVVPVAVTGVATSYTLITLDRSRDLQTRGVQAEATVVSSEWWRLGESWLTVDVAGYEQVTLTQWDGVPGGGEVIDVIVDPHDPSLVAQTAAGIWGQPERASAVVAGLGLVTLVTVVPAAVTGLVRRRGAADDGPAPRRAR